MVVGEVDGKHVWMAGVPGTIFARFLDGEAEPNWIWL